MEVPIDKLLTRIEESGRREEVVAALMDSNLPSPNTAISPRRIPWSQGQASNSPFDHSRSTNCGSSSLPTQRNSPTQDGSQEAETLVSPLHIVTAAIAANTEPRCEKLGSQASLHPGRIAAMAPIKERLSKYFASHRAQKKDWEILAAQSVGSSFKLERGTCDPIASRLIDNNDASLYFQLFFQLRNPVIGLMDPTFHTPEYVYSTSFTLFSVICALGCAVSVRPRDRVIYPVLLSLADGNLRWSIAAAVKSLATIQAIINMQYWAPISSRQADDPYWLFVSHAVQLAREIGINRPEIVSEYVNAESQNTSSEFKDRCLRNYERTWFYTFIADKGFGIVTGRSQGVGWREMPRCASDWWKRSMTEPTDRMISGMVEIRGLLASRPFEDSDLTNTNDPQQIQAMEKRRQIQSTPKAILEWHKEAYDTLTRIRNDRCAPDDLPSARCLPILAFYMDHSLLVLNAQALKDMTAADDSIVSTAVLAVVRKTIEVASRALDLVLTDRTMTELLLGFQNNQYIMICHAITEILRAIKRGGLTSEETLPAVEKVLAIPQFLDRVVQLLPSSSAGHLYLDLARFFACQVEVLTTASDVQTVRETIDSGMFSDDWFKTVDSGLPDAATFLDMGYLGLEQPTPNFNDFQDTNSFNYSM
ncbi:hypothetical protein FSARC_3606 [Fusarium sarcochroum]|uniref:Xylanolytic transcriptional activator regulatory domain-containing protein n=1 Tax=Fusarium sarcochroum TaxID=1208366 RepID=A0A8H4U428_9HYPO|nr:hypothetical protein FSARC_3606 [Fusarium sarcochroum]